MSIADLLTPEQIVANMLSTEHIAAIEELVGHLGRQGFLGEVSVEAAVKALADREDQTSTGIGSSVAIPHAFLPGLESVVAAVGRSKEGIDFEAIDNVPVELVFLFLVPENEYQIHLETLAAIARALQDGETRAQLIEARDRKAILGVIRERFVG